MNFIILFLSLFIFESYCSDIEYDDEASTATGKRKRIVEDNENSKPLNVDVNNRNAFTITVPFKKRLVSLEINEKKNFQLGIELFQKKDYKKSLNLLRNLNHCYFNNKELSKKNFLISVMKYYGWGCDVDYSFSYKLLSNIKDDSLEQHFKKDHQMILAEMYYFGYGCKCNYDLSKECLLKTENKNLNSSFLSLKKFFGSFPFQVVVEIKV